MRFALSAFVMAALSVQQAISLPLLPPFTPAEIISLQVTAYLESFESSFYGAMAAQFGASDFNSSGFPPEVQRRYLEILSHERTHFKIINGLLGPNAQQACNFSFPGFTTLEDFTSTSYEVEGTGTAAYNGLVGSITSPGLLPPLSSIYGVEGEQWSWIASSVVALPPWGGAGQNALTGRMAITIVSPFNQTCPTGVPAVQPFTPLVLQNSTLIPGELVPIPGVVADNTFATFLSGGVVTSVPIVNGSARAPVTISAVGFLAVTNSQNLTDESIVFGPTVFSAPFAANNALTN